MAGAENPFNQIGGIDTVSGVVKADFVTWAKTRVPQVMATPAELRSFDLTGQNMVYVKSTQYVYASDTADTTTADDGLECIHDANALRFKRVPSVGDMLRSNLLSDLNSPQAIAFDNISKHGVDVASAATINLDAATGSVVDVTGTTTITAVTLSDGKRRLVRFTGVLQITNGASLVLPGGANIKTAAGDYILFVGYAAGVVRAAFFAPSQRPRFSAHKNGTNQTGLTDATFTVITWPTEDYDIGGYFTSDGWTPPAGIVSLSAALSMSGTITSGVVQAIRITKNGTALKQATNTSATNQADAFINVIDIANGTDVYKVEGFVDTSSGTGTVSGTATLSWFQGVWLGT